MSSAPHLPEKLSENVLLQLLCERVQPSRKLSVTVTLSQMFYCVPGLKIDLLCKAEGSFKITYNTLLLLLMFQVALWC